MYNIGAKRKGTTIRRRQEKARTAQLLLLLPLVAFTAFSLWPIFNNGGAHSLHRDEPTEYHHQTMDDFMQHLEQVDNITESLRTLLQAAASRHKDEDRFPTFDPQVELARCQRYGFDLDTSKPLSRRRIFWGSLIADDSWHIVGIAAMEYYGLIDTIAFVESNTTQSLASRTMRFPENSSRKKVLTSPLLWGDNTRIHVDYYLKENFDFGSHGLWRENDQRNVIFQRWKKNGMTHEDIGLISDMDEVVTHDFLQALQVCIVPEFLPTATENRTSLDRGNHIVAHYDCLAPKILTNTFCYEGSPQCLATHRRLWHPDFIIGACIQEIGDDSLRGPPTPREVVGYGAYMRLAEWKSNVTEIKLEGSGDTVRLGPLWDATDFRLLEGGRQILGRTTTGLEIPTAYHFHNFFDSIATLRGKYLTYGHAVDEAMDIPLWKLQEEIGFMVGCLTNRSNLAPKDQLAGPEDWEKWDAVHSTPIAFQRIPAYRTLRHRELQVQLTIDERMHPPN